MEAPLGSQAVLDRYRALLHEYRAHKASLGDWLAAFPSQQRRPPQLLDAEATGDPELLARFQQYLMARKRLLAEIPLLREQLDEAGADTHHHTSSSSSGSGSSGSHKHHHHHHHGSVNANQAAPISRSQAVGQFFAAVNYRQQHGARKLAAAEAGAGSSSSSSAVQPAAADSQLQVTEVLQQRSPAAAATGADAAAAPAPVVAASLGQDLSDLAAGSSPSSSSSSPKADGAAHLLSSITSQAASSSSGSSRATAAAMAALAYKKQKQQPAGPDSSSSSSSGRVGRGLAMLQAEAPQLPAGIDAAAAAAGRVVVGVVETAKGDVNAARRNSRALDADVSLEATLQGVPGGLGSSSGTAMFASTIAVQSAAAGSMGAASAAATTSGSGSPVLAPPPGADASSPVGEVVTARFDVYAGRRRVLAPDAALDEYFAGLEAAAAAAAAAMMATTDAAQAQQQRAGGASGSSSAASSDGGGKKSDAAGGSKAQQQQQQQQQQQPPAAKRVQQADGYGGLLPDIVPLPI